MILVLDDCPRRAGWFRRQYGARNVLVHHHAGWMAWNLWMSYRNKLPIEAIYLDHDLGGGMTGLDVAKYLAGTGIHTDTPIKIHSSNYQGAIAMRDALKDTHRVELVTLDFEDDNPTAVLAQQDTPTTEPTGVDLIAAERRRQVEREGWTPAHDDEHDEGEMAFAAALYAMPRRDVRISTPQWTSMVGLVSYLWPWDRKWWKPSPGDRIRELTKAGALIAAEIDRIKRAQQDTTNQKGGA